MPRNQAKPRETVPMCMMFSEAEPEGRTFTVEEVADLGSEWKDRPLDAEAPAKPARNKAKK